MNEKHEIQDEMILITSDEAATYRKNIEGWVSRQGHYYGEKGENSARYEGCTHRPCQECGEPAEKTWLYCKECRDKRDIDRYNKREKKVWDGEAWLYSELLQDYIGPDNLDDWFEDNTIEELMLVICEPQTLPELDDGDYGSDVLPEETDLPDGIIEAISVFNTAVKDAGTISWYPGKYAAVIE